MQRKKITPTEVRTAIDQYLTTPESRHDISLLDLPQVTAYIDMLKKIIEEYQPIQHEADQFFADSQLKHDANHEKRLYLKNFKHYTFTFEIHYRWPNDKTVLCTILPPLPASTDMHNLLFELEQQKHQLEHLHTLEDRMIRNRVLKNPLISSKPTLSLDEDEKKAETIYAYVTPPSEEDAIVLHAQDTIALEALAMYQNLFTAHRTLSAQYEALKSQDAEKTSLLTQLSEQNEKLTTDLKSVQSQLRTQLKHLQVSFKQNGELREKTKKMEAESKTTQTTLETLQQEVGRFRSIDYIKENQRLGEETTELRSQLSQLMKNQQRLERGFFQLEETNKILADELNLTKQFHVEEEKNHKYQTSGISREVLAGLLYTLFTQNKNRSNFFSPKVRNETRENLRRLAHKQQDRLSFDEVIDCIKDPLLVKILKYPAYPCKKVTATVTLIQTLGTLFAEQQHATNRQQMSFVAKLS